MIVKRLGPLSVAKISGFLYAGIGLLIGIMFSFISLVASSMGSGLNNAGDLPGMVFGIGAIIFLPIVYGLMGFLAGALSAWLYNLAAGWMGGFEIEFEDDRPSQPVDFSRPPIV